MSTLDAPCHDGVLQSAEECQTANAAPQWALAAAIGGSATAFVVGSVVNVALPALQRALGASVAEVQWVLNAYLLMLGALILVGGAAGDRLGRRRVFVIGLAVFASSSVACGLAPSAGWLIAARAVQGVGAALLVPTSLALLSAAYPKGEARGRAIGTWAASSALTTALGPVLGGWLVDAFSWRWVFFVAVPPALVTLAIALWKVPESEGEPSGSLDVLGSALAVVGFGAAVFGLVAAGNRGWTDSLVLASLVGGFIVLGVFVWVESRVDNPILPLSLFRSSTFSGANGMTLLLYFALNGVLFFLPFNLIQVQGYSAAAAGAAFLPFSLTIGFLSRSVGGVAERWGARLTLVAGSVIASVGLALLAVPGVQSGPLGSSYWATFFLPMAVLGLGMTLAVAPLTNTVMSAVDDAQAGTASGVNNAAARIAALLAVAVFGVVAVGVFGATLDSQLVDLSPSGAIEAALTPFRSDLTGATLPNSLDASERQLAERLVGDAFVTAFRWTAGLAAGSAILSAAVAALTVDA